MTLPIAALDVPQPAVEADTAQCRAAYLLARVAVLLAHPEAAAPGVPATPGELAEYSHLLHDADEDAVTRPFVYLRKGTKP
jgi:hypothetical protein